MSKLTDEQENELFEKLKKERQKELSGLNAPQKATAETMLKGMLRDKLSATESSFIPKGQKSAGVSSGYVAKEKETGETFILKHFYKRNLDIPSGFYKEMEQHEQDRQDAVRELLGSTMYQFLLYDRAPKEGLVTPDKGNPDSLYVRSKFFANSTTLSEFSGLPPSGHLKSTNKLQALEGLEKVNAACDFLGEIDYHGGNLMVQDGKTITKIDHGRSFMANFTDFGSMVKARHSMFSGCSYTKAIQDGNLSFDIRKYSHALNQMLQQYDKQQMEAVIDQKFDELKKVGFDPRGTVVFPMDQENAILINSFDELKQFYKDQMRERATIMRDVAQSAEIVCKFSNVPDEFKNGGWIKSFNMSPIQDPVAYAAHHNIQIEGQNALEWAYNNDYKIKIPAQRTKETTTEEQWQKDASGKWLKKESVATRDRIEITSQDPIEYITYNKKKLGLKLSRSEKEFLAQAMEINLTNDSGKSVKSMLGNGDLKRAIKPAIATIQSQDKDTTNTLVKLVNNFVQETTGTEVTTEKAIEFYDEVLSTLEKQKYLTKQDVANIKKEPDYIIQAEKTAKLMETQTSRLDLKGVDKMYYQLARFTQAIRLPKISKYFTESITTEKVKRIDVIEAALSHSLKVSTTVSDESKPVLRTKRLENVRAQVKKKLGGHAER